MRLLCEVETVYTLAQTLGGNDCACKNKKSRASVSIGKRDKDDELFLTVSTVKNVSGMKYKIRNNIDKVFARFLKEGRVTIRFKDPAHDLSISKADPVQLKQFMSLLRLSPQEQRMTSIAPDPQPKIKDLEKPQTKLVVKSKGDYPLGGFPSTLEVLEAVVINLNRVDRRILALSNLHLLDLSGNCIKSIPEEIKTLRLAELKLAGNKIAEFPVGACYGTLTDTLRTLDLSRNELTHIPFQFQHFKQLVTLRLDCNQLRLLPRSFGKLTSLRFLFASSNKLAVLPHSFSYLKLESLDLFGNPFKASGLVKRCSNLSLPTLVEISGRVVKKFRLPYSPETLPVVLCHYLDSAKKCLCGTACLESYLHYIASLSLHKISSTVTTVDQSGTTRVPIELFLCSAKCLKLWKHYE